MPSDVDPENLSGIYKNAIEKVHDAGYRTLQSIAVASTDELSETANIDEASAAEIIRAARQEADIGTLERPPLPDKSDEPATFSVGVDSFDEILDGGIETQAITEVYGESGAGKSQLLHQLAVNVQLPKEHGGLEGSALVIDSEDSFRPDRIEQMVKGQDEETLEDALVLHGIVAEGEGNPTDPAQLDALVESVLENIHVAKAFNSSHQMLLAEKKAREIASEKLDDDFPVRLFCVDSLTAHFRAEYLGRGEPTIDRKKFNTHLHDIDTVGQFYDTAVVVTRQSQSDPETEFGDPTDPILALIPTTRIRLKKSTQGKRIVSRLDAPDRSTNDVIIQITEHGFEPVTADPDDDSRSGKEQSRIDPEGSQTSSEEPEGESLLPIKNHTEYFALVYALGETGGEDALSDHERLEALKPDGRELEADLERVKSLVRGGKVSEAHADTFAAELARLRIQEVNSNSAIVDPDKEGVKRVLKEMILEPV